MRKVAPSLDDQIEATRAHLPVIERELDDAEAELVESPSDAALIEKRNALVKERDQVNARIESLTRAKRGIASRATESAKRERAKVVTAARKDLGASGEPLLEVVSAAIGKINELGPLLLQAELLIKERNAHAWTALRDCFDSTDNALRRFDDMVNEARGQHLCAYILEAIWNSGLGRIGFHLPEHFFSIARIENERPLGEYFDKHESGLLSKIDSAMAAGTLKR